MTAPSGPSALQVRVRVAGFVDRTSGPDDKLAGIRAGHPADYSSTRPPLSYGDPGSQELKAEAKQKQKGAGLLGLATPIVGAHPVRDRRLVGIAS